MKTNFIFIILILFCKTSTFSQIGINTGNTSETPQEYYLNVKQFSEFIDRFNYLSDWKGNKMSNDFKSKVSRSQYIGYLINQEDQRIKKNDTAYVNLCNRFIADIINPQNPQTISLYSGQVIANTDVSIDYKGKSQQIKIQFIPEVLNDRSAKWVIQNVDADCFKNMADSLNKYFIAPNSNETNFINVKRIENLSNPLYFFPNEMNSSPTLLFMTESAAGRLKIKTIEKVVYEITFKGWKIKVEEFVRNTNNSGWLISDIQAIN